MAKPTAKTTTKKTAAKKTAPKVQGPKPIKDRMNKTQLIQHLVDKTELDKKDVKAVMEALEETMVAHVRKRGCGEFMFPGMFKIVTKKVPAKKARKGVSPFTGEETTFKAKPATTKTKIRPLKKLKDAVLS